MRRVGFTLLLLTFVFASHAQQRHDIIISELMADPSPAVGLPAYEWLELYNPSNQAIDLAGFRIGDGTSVSGPLPSFLLAPQSFILIGSSTALPFLRMYGNAVSVTSFPSLDNEGDLVWIKDRQGTTLHAVNYQASWYGSQLKKEGGWTLEMIDPGKPCIGSGNWTASSAASGGTPGQVNSVNGVVHDDSSPEVMWSIATDGSHLQVQFNESIDSVAASQPDHYLLEGGNLRSVEVVPPLFTQAIITLDNPLEDGRVYELHLRDIPDCGGNKLLEEVIRTGKPVIAEVGDIVVNELLFDPKPGGQDYVELFNNGVKLVDLYSLYLGNRNSNGEVANMMRLSTVKRPFFPGDYYVITSDPVALERQYTVQNKKAVLAVPALPSYPDDKGTVLLVDEQERILEELNYEDSWQFALLSDAEGIALERLSPDRPVSESSNWHSASSVSGYGTPGYLNSQFNGVPTGEGQIYLDTEIFSPDQDGWQDVVQLCYQLPEVGFIGNLYVYDATGVRVRHLARNEVLGRQGCWKWDGLDQRMRPLPIGQYILFLEYFNLDGRSQQVKKVVALARARRQ